MLAVLGMAEPNGKFEEFEIMDAELRSCSIEEVLSGRGPLRSLPCSAGPSDARTGLGESLSQAPQAEFGFRASVGTCESGARKNGLLGSPADGFNPPPRPKYRNSMDVFAAELLSGPPLGRQLCLGGADSERSESGVAPSSRDIEFPLSASARAHDEDQALASCLQLVADEEAARALAASLDDSSSESSGVQSRSTQLVSSFIRDSSPDGAGSASPVAQHAAHSPQPNVPLDLRERMRSLRVAEELALGLRDVVLSRSPERLQPARPSQQQRPAQPGLGRMDQQLTQAGAALERMPRQEVQSETGTFEDVDQMRQILREALRESFLNAGRAGFAVPGARPAAVAGATTTMVYRAADETSSAVNVGEDGGGRSIAEQDKHLCTICCETFQDGDPLRLLPCFHRYHAACVDRWLAQSRTCPVCKHDITT